ncbi:MAG: archaeal heat shock protein Hsp20 [Halobacteria archaeon]
MAIRNPFRSSRDSDDSWEDLWEGDLFGDLFSDFDDRFRQMRRQMARLFERARRGELSPPEQGGPYVYGWTFRLDDGKPQFREFGNVKGLTLPQRAGLEPGYREPLTDLIESEKTLSVTFEMPGIEKSDIDLQVVEEGLVVKVDKKDRKYWKEVSLPRPVKTDSAKATYKNGVLEITLELAEAQPKGKKVKVE